jgi:hypothetical protein
MAGMTKLAVVSGDFINPVSQYVLGDATSRVTPPTNEGIRGTNNVLVEETGRPDLARNKCSTKNANEETDEVEPHGVVRSAGERSGDRTSEEQTRESQTRANVIAHRTSNRTNDKRGSERNDVGVGNLILRQVHIGLDTLA